MKVLAALYVLGATARENAVLASEIKALLKLHLRSAAPDNVHEVLRRAATDVEAVSDGESALKWRLTKSGLKRLGESTKMELLQEQWDTAAAGSQKAAKKSAAVMAVSESSVFIVHGHDDGARDAVARFVEKLGLEAVILHEQPNKGRTIIEKFEAHAAVGFAIVLLTPDDVGAQKSKAASLSPRARQNVVFELGYFIGKLGRERVCALHKEEVELPSDFSGVVYVKMDDAGGWRLKLAQEMKAAKLPAKFDKAI
ncbi:MAG TPA: nucleotide-binding protein [Myxococcaceae bacterium]|jgi:predicted nucleotide-binding protein